MLWRGVERHLLGHHCIHGRAVALSTGTLSPEASRLMATPRRRVRWRCCVSVWSGQVLIVAPLGATSVLLFGYRRSTQAWLRKQEIKTSGLLDIQPSPFGPINLQP